MALRFECRIHSFGALSTTIRKALGWIGNDDTSDPGAQESSQGPKEVVVAEGDQSEFIRLRKKSWARLIARTWLEDPSLCSTCGKEMKGLAAISSPAQDDVIEKILRAQGRWNPPWLKHRPARGPPGSEVPSWSRAKEVDGFEPPPLDEVYLLDREPPDAP